MSFVDKAEVVVQAGDGGNGKLSFRHEKFINKGGPDGGDGGRGGNIVLIGRNNQNTLASFRYKKELLAEAGHPGEANNKHGRNGKDLIVAVPVGTVALNENNDILADITADNQTVIIAQGGQGGFGNAHFVSSRRQAPNFAEKGEPGQKLSITLELKMIADVGLVGLPNAGKSTLLSRISNAHPEIANYPFTTLRPHLGVVDVNSSTSLLFADIPGLIEGASSGKGLGFDFLRHIERTAIIVHLIDIYEEDIVTSYKKIRQELKAYNRDLINRQELVVLTKAEGLDQETILEIKKVLMTAIDKKSEVIAISAHSGLGLKDLVTKSNKLVRLNRQNKNNVAEQTSTIPVLTIDDKSDYWQVKRFSDYYKVSGSKIEKFARRTDYQNEESVRRLRYIMQKQGIMHELSRQNIHPGDKIVIDKNIIVY